ncbi:hypothetical protein [Acinetobacter sp. ANC 3813]|uniref:hypothetical protein n=1 Tax=Acinetobacter sp. ANC 3813 TaxID=1977873 RepID=UPI000A355C5C|nr:hypothetical protein [Acinetobacter sp. ANC 3813]OTG90538.1 hypothetical protein B9T34_08565 [Acinetobacter sp. ANC 3813]
MWKFLAKLISPKKVETVKSENNAEVVVVAEDYINNELDYDYCPFYPSVSEFEQKLFRLRSYDGHLRQEILEDLRECFDPLLFPHLLWRLNDYVQINQKLAVDHLQRWSERPEFSELCLQNFFEIAALQKRLRVNPKVFHLLMNNIGQNKLFLVENLTQKQGRLPRALLTFAVEFEWLDEKELILLCRHSKDQLVRKYWLDQLIQTSSDQQMLSILKNSQQKDVQYELFNELWKKDALTVNDLIEVWHSPYLAVMDYADFALRQKNFNFDQYFQDHPFESLSKRKLRLRAYQWMIRKGSLTEFFQMIQSLNNPLISMAILQLALKRKYIGFEYFNEYYQSVDEKLTLNRLLKLRKLTGQHLSIVELEHLVVLSEPISLLQRLELVESYNRWEQLYWYALQLSSINGRKEQNLYDMHVQRRLWRINDEIYPPHWSAHQKQYLQSVVPSMMQQFPEVFSGQNVRKILEQRLDIKM